MMRPVTTRGLQVPYSRWELVALGLWLVLLVGVGAWLISEGEVAALVFMSCAVTGAGVWDVYTRHARPEYFSRRGPRTEQSVATALVVAGGLAIIVFADEVAEKLLVGGFVLAYVASVIGDRTRPLPDPSVAMGKEGLIKRYETGIRVALFVSILIFIFLTS